MTTFKLWLGIRPPDEVKHLRADVREVVHDYRNLATRVVASEKRAQRAASTATQVAEDAINRLEAARYAREENGNATIAH